MTLSFLLRTKQYTINAMMVLLSAPFLHSCSSSSSDYDEPLATAEDTAKIDQFTKKLQTLFENKKAGVGSNQFGEVCHLEKGERDALILRWDEVSKLFEPVSNAASPIKYTWSADQDNIVRKLKDKEYSVKLSKAVEKAEKGKYILMLETSSRIEPTLAGDEFTSGVFTGTVYVFDIESAELECSVEIVAENMPMISYRSTDSQADINRKMQRDLDASIQAQVKKVRGELFAPK